MEVFLDQRPSLLAGLLACPGAGPRCWKTYPVGKVLLALEESGPCTVLLALEQGRGAGKTGQVKVLACPGGKVVRAFFSVV